MRKRSEAARRPSCTHEGAELGKVRCSICGEVMLPRTPGGHINNCALANGELARDCQMCGGDCPDAARLANRDLALETGRKLADELGQGSSQTGLRSESLFVNHNRVELRPDAERLVDTVFRVEDLDAAYTRLERGLTIGEERGDRGTISRAVDEAEDNFLQAHRVYCSASLERTRFELEAEVVIAAMRRSATDALEQEKELGARKKMITDADVVGKAAAMFPEDWRRLHMKRARVKLMVEQCERLVDAWGKRCSSTDELLRSVRK